MGVELAPFNLCHLLLYLIRARHHIRRAQWFANFTKHPICCGVFLNLVEFYDGNMFEIYSA